MAPPRDDEIFKGDARTINMSKHATQDRFSLPPESLVQSKSGIIMTYGIRDRPSRKVRPDSRTTATGTGVGAVLWSPRQPRTINTKSILNPTPLPRASPYVAAVQERERRYGHYAELARGAARCAHTSYGSRVRDGSRVAAALKWQTPPLQPTIIQSQNIHTMTPSPYLSSYLKRIAARERQPAPAVPSSSSISPAAAAIGEQHSLFTASSPRFAAHAASDINRATTPDLGPQKDRARLQYHAARRASVQKKQHEVQVLANQWPHGLPTARRLSAEKKGLFGLGGLGYGNSASSMPDRQYQAMRSCMKGP